jgi:hypothetical protein
MGLVRPIQQIQSGVVNDYVTWIVVGAACIGGVLAYAIRLAPTDSYCILVTCSGRRSSAT